MNVRLRIVMDTLLVAAMAGVVALSYHEPVSYRFEGSLLVLALSVLAVASTLLWRGREIRRRDWFLPGGLVLLGLASYPDTSLDFMRYLFDGEMIRMWHASPYTHLPLEFPLDQYSSVFQYRFWVHIPSPYGPLWQAAMVAVNWVTGNAVIGGILALKLINLAGILVCARYLYLVSGRAWTAFVFLLNPVVLLNTVATPHFDVLIAVAVLAAYHHRDARARGGMLAIATLLKVHAVIFAPFFSRKLRDQGVLVASLAMVAGVLLLALQPITGFEWVTMLSANAGGGVNARDSLLAYNLAPWLPLGTIFAISYALFAAGYGAVLAAYWRGRVSSLTALAMASFLVPLCLTGLLSPWHFIIPLVLLLPNKRILALWVVLFLTLTVSRSAVTVLEVLEVGAVLGAGCWVLYWAYRRFAKPPWLFSRVVRALS